MRPVDGSCNDQTTITRPASSHIQSIRNATETSHVVEDCAMYTSNLSKDILVSSRCEERNFGLFQETPLRQV